jgi:nucleotide-binding universal stress UspA family protein
VTRVGTPPPSIVCGVDLPDDAGVSLHVAAELAQSLDRRLVVVHVPHVRAPGVMPVVGLAAPMAPPSPVHMRESAREQVRELVESEGLDAEVRIEVGFPAEVLADVADRENAELIVVGSRGQGPFRAAFLGSVSNELIGVARCPVVVVPRGVAA